MAKSFPVVGHVISAGYAIAGDLEEAEKIALGATKSTLIAAASASCGLVTAGKVTFFTTYVVSTSSTLQCIQYEGYQNFNLFKNAFR